MGVVRPDVVMSPVVFEQLVDAHHTSLYRSALSRVRREGDACHRGQQTFFIGAESGHTMREASKAKTWLFTTVYREFLEGRGKEGRAQSIEDLPLTAQDLAAEEVDQARPLDAAQRGESAQEEDEVFRALLTPFGPEDPRKQPSAEAVAAPGWSGGGGWRRVKGRGSRWGRKARTCSGWRVRRGWTQGEMCYEVSEERAGTPKSFLSL